ncbi:DMT family transporter [Methylobacterium currus]|uniref:aromatic amino acid exporter YddG n=1 Tax=Methylobacterium currus TaxID=2051553 RepID=UPI001E33093D|nr:DMT family transporter [Methylobacterium currus]UHC15736.1 DMT family transporter [Methylobacterium currus]
MKRLQYGSRTMQGHVASQGAATAIGFVAVVFWSALALLTKMAGNIPPFQLLFLSFFVAFVFSIMIIAWRGYRLVKIFRQPIQVWLFSFTAIFIYHALYFFALQNAPPAEASLLAYLWPLLIVIFSIFLERKAFHAKHLIGALLGFGGCAVAILGQSSSLSKISNYSGYIAALLCALVWSTYSVINRRFSDVPSEIIGGVCGLVAIAALPFHLATENAVYPTMREWIAIIILGFGPTGLAFFAWDYATKWGHLPTIGALSYLAPLFSTLLLIAAGWTAPRWTVVAATLLTVGGAVIATFDHRKVFSGKFNRDGV